MIIAFTNTKGGVSKSTLSCNGVLLLHDLGYRVSLLDTDEQTSSSTWIQRAEPTIPVAIANRPDDIEARLKELSACSDIVIVDTPGHASDAAHAVAMLCDLAVVPVQPSKLDIRAIRDALQFVLLAQKLSGGSKPEIRIVITHTSKEDVEADELQATIESSLRVPVLNARMRQLKGFRKSPDSSVHRMKGPQAKNAAKDVEAIFTELLADYLQNLRLTDLKRVANE